MPADGGDAPVPAPPRADDLLAIGADDWAWVLGPVRRALHALDDAHVTAEVQRLRASPASRLAGGRTRQQLARLLSRGGPVWEEIHTALVAADPPDTLTWLVAGGRPVRGPASRAPARGRAAPARRDDAEVRRLRDRAKELRQEVDSARRQASGAEARADALEAKLAEVDAELDRERRRAAALESELAQAREEITGAVERERRRTERRLADLEAELAEVRRREETRREQRAREQRARDAAERQAREEAAAAERRRREPEAKVRPGRPTRLPAGIAPGTREEAEALLGPGRLVFVDGYNVTITHRRELMLEEQREWLIRLLSGLAARRRVRPRVVFDGRGGGGGGRAGDSARGVAVTFTPEGVTADDEITLAVQGTDEPLVVVTDDRGLRDRVRPHGVDLLRTTPFLWAAG